MQRSVCALFVAMFVLACARAVPRLSLCDLAKNPAKYNHKEIQITAFVSHGFEDFSLFDPACTSRELHVWVEYGGGYGSGTIYCCNDPKQNRPEQLVLEGIPTTLVRDGQFALLDAFIQKERDTVVYATLRGRYFSGEKEKFPGGTLWAGYGHFGLSSLFVIEQVVEVAPHDLPDIDYGASYEQPSLDGQGCFSAGFNVPSYHEAIAQQQEADRGGEAWRFEAPQKIALMHLKPHLDGAQLTLRQTKRAAGRIIFQGTATGRQYDYMAVVSRPYWLTHFARDPRRIVWVLTKAYESGCPKPPWLPKSGA